MINGQEALYLPAAYSGLNFRLMSDPEGRKKMEGKERERWPQPKKSSQSGEAED